MEMYLLAEDRYNIFKLYNKKGYFPITDTRMTRFNITLHEATNMV